MIEDKYGYDYHIVWACDPTQGSETMLSGVFNMPRVESDLQRYCILDNVRIWMNRLPTNIPSFYNWSKIKLGWP